MLTPNFFSPFLGSEPTGVPFRIDNIESIARLTKVTLETCGDSVHLQSFHFLWKAATAALTDAEQKVFPTMPVETPQELHLPPRWRSLALVTSDSWKRFEPWVHPAFDSLEKIFFWIQDNYDTQIHENTMTMVSDGLLLVETIACLRGRAFNLVFLLIEQEICPGCQPDWRLSDQSTSVSKRRGCE